MALDQVFVPILKIGKVPARAGFRNATFWFGTLKKILEIRKIMLIPVNFCTPLPLKSPNRLQTMNMAQLPIAQTTFISRVRWVVVG
jgi:hypothetical protein